MMVPNRNDDEHVCHLGCQKTLSGTHEHTYMNVQRYFEYRDEGYENSCYPN